MSEAVLPRIQISGEATEKARLRYCQAIAHAGGIPVAGHAPAPDLTCAGLLLCGGEDIDPAFYGQRNCGSQPPDIPRDEAELKLFRAFFEAGKPIFGICRGIQLINVALGGTLIQDLPPESRIFHQGGARSKIHPIRAGAGSLLERLYGTVFPVNSIHHQAVDLLGDGLSPTAWAESGFVEAVEHRTHPVFAVQFHPERMCFALRRPDTVDGEALFRHFIDLCRG